MAGRGYGRGSLYQRSSDGLWMGALRVGGKQQVVSSRSKEEAERRLDALVAAQPPRLTRLASPAEARRSVRMADARALGDHTDGQWWAKVRSLQRICHYCGFEARPVTKDHLLPVSRGGSNSIDNVVPCCKPCNSAKRTMTAEEFLAVGEPHFAKMRRREVLRREISAARRAGRKFSL